MTHPTALTIAGSDPSGGAGIQADLKTFHAHGVYGTSVVTLLTAQNTLGVSAVQSASESMVDGQLRAVLSDMPPAAAKTGALGSAPTIECLLARLEGSTFPLVVDPVMVSTSGDSLLDADGRRALRRLFARATLITPNLPEAEALLGRAYADPVDDARALLDLGTNAVLLKGGHASGAALDVLVSHEGVQRLESPRVDTKHTHGTGCSLSAAITARLALGEGLGDAVRCAKAWVYGAIASAPGLGAGHGPINHFFPIPTRAAPVKTG
ncbi:MAG: bifunctional hydroxymethylpyrimidine kinase/phosphomethylpyrimidine kinase [Myxococcota bacterium]